MSPNPAVLTWPRKAVAAGPVVLDTFTRANSALPGSTADTGQVWSGSGGASVVGGRAAFTGANGDRWATIDSGVSNFVLTADLNYTADAAILLFRVNHGVFANDMLGVEVTAIGVAVVKKNGPFQSLERADMTVTAAAHTISVTCSGSTIEVAFDGSTVLTHTLADFQTRTAVGFYTYRSTSTWDNLSVTAL